MTTRAHRSKRVRERVDLAICAIAKNEGRYIREWLSYHYLVGVRRFFIYDNGSSDDMVEEIFPMASLGARNGHSMACCSRPARGLRRRHHEVSRRGDLVRVHRLRRVSHVPNVALGGRRSEAHASLLCRRLRPLADLRVLWAQDAHIRTCDEALHQAGPERLLGERDRQVHRQDEPCRRAWTEPSLVRMQGAAPERSGSCD